MSALGRRHRGACTAGAIGIGTAIVLVMTGCSNSGGSPATDTSATTPSAPVGVVAIGHSGLTGENSDSTHPGQPALENSWATGSSPAVDSVYLRLVAAHPATAGHVANAAVGGASFLSLASQATTALQSVPAPELVIVQTIDNDIQCNGTDDANVTKFGTNLQQTLESINTASPQSKILVVGQLGRPSTSFVTQLVAADPSIQASLTGPGICDFFDPQGTLNNEGFAELTRIIDAYEAEQERVCAAVANCRTDGGVRAAYIDRLENFTDDWAHINVAGQAAEAELIWPVVADFLSVN